MKLNFLISLLFFFKLIFVLKLIEIVYCAEVYKLDSDRDLDSYFVDNDAVFNGLIVCSLHGDEPLGSLVVQKIISRLPENFNYYIVLQPSKYRIEKNIRNNFEGLDPNRTFINLYSQSAQFIVSLINKVDPLFVIDIHQAKRENVNFLYSFGNFSRIIDYIYSQDKKYGLLSSDIYNPYYFHIMDLQKRLEKDSSSVFSSTGAKIQKYTVPNSNYSYGNLSILRNFAASKGIFSILFEVTYLDGNDKILEKILIDYLEFLYDNKDSLVSYKNYCRKWEKIYFISKFFLIPFYYESHSKLLDYLNTLGINYYLFSSSLDKHSLLYDSLSFLRFFIRDISIGYSSEFKNFVYLNLRGEFRKIDIIDREFYIVRGSVLSSFILNPIYGESLWNFLAIPYGNKYLPIYFVIDERKNL